MMSVQRPSLARPAVVVYAGACLIHAVVLIAVEGNLAACCLAPDSAGYITLSRSGWFDFVRLPGYPAFLWGVGRLFGESLRAVLWTQVFVSSLTPAFIAIFSVMAFPRFRAAPYVAGALGAVSFTAVTLTHFILAEVLVAALVTAALVALYAGARRRSTMVLLASSLLGGLAFLTRPAFLFWGVVAPVMAILFTRRRPTTAVLAGSAVLALAFPVSWSFVNLSRFGVLTPSGGGAATACVYLAGRAQAIVAVPTGPTFPQLEAGRQALLDGGSVLETEAEKYRYYTRCVVQTALTHPVATWRAYRASLREGLPRPFDADELRWRTAGGTVPQKLLTLGLRWMTNLLYATALLGMLRLLAEREGRVVAGLMLLFGVNWLLSGTTYLQGARLMYPVESILLVFAAVGCTPRNPRPAVSVQPLLDRPAPAAGSSSMSIVIPAFNQAATIGQFVDTVAAADLVADTEIIVVDDASTDGTDRVLASSAARDPRIRAFRHGERRGAGAAIGSGLARTTGAIVILHRPDALYDPRDYAKFVAPIADGRADAVYGTRFGGDSRCVMPLWRRTYTWLLTTISNVVNNLTLTDLDAGLKAFRGGMVRTVRVDSDESDFEAFVTANLARRGARFTEAPIGYARDAVDARSISVADALGSVFAGVRGRFGDRDRRTPAVRAASPRSE